MTTWYVSTEGTTQGPYSYEELVQRFNSGTLHPTTLICEAGTQQWFPLGQLFQPQPVAPQPSPQVQPTIQPKKKSRFWKGCGITVAVLISLPIILVLCIWASCKVRACKEERKDLDEAAEAVHQDPCTAVTKYSPYTDRIKAGELEKHKSKLVTAVKTCINENINDGQQSIENDDVEKGLRQLKDACWMSKGYDWLIGKQKTACERQDEAKEEIKQTKQEDALYSSIMDPMERCEWVSIPKLEKFNKQPGDRFASAKKKFPKMIKACLETLDSDLEEALRDEASIKASENFEAYESFIKVVEEGLVPGASEDEIPLDEHRTKLQKSKTALAKLQKKTERELEREQKAAEKKERACLKAEDAYNDCFWNCLMDHSAYKCDKKCASKRKKYERVCDVEEMPEIPSWL